MYGEYNQKDYYANIGHSSLFVAIKQTILRRFGEILDSPIRRLTIPRPASPASRYADPSMGSCVSETAFQTLAAVHELYLPRRQNCICH